MARVNHGLAAAIALVAMPVTIGCGRDVGDEKVAGGDEVGGDTGSSSGQGSSTTFDDIQCDAALQTGTEEPAGLLVCSDRSVQRESSTVCSGDVIVLDESEGECGACDRFATAGVCRIDPGQGVFCHYDCSVDADCGPGALCVCASNEVISFNQCIIAECATADDCGPHECGVSFADRGRPTSANCRGDDDECHGDDDCPDSDGCLYGSVHGRFRCVNVSGE